MRCPRCGTENPAGRVLCSRCGARLRVGAGTAGPSPGSAESNAVLMGRLRTDLVRLAVVTAVVVAVTAALGLLLR